MTGFDEPAHIREEHLPGGIRRKLGASLSAPVVIEHDDITGKIFTVSAKDLIVKSAQPVKEPVYAPLDILIDIREHYMEDISLTSLAAKYNISMARLSEMIKEHLNLNFSDYIAALRIQRAKELLRDESLSIQEIAEIVGYNDYFYFTKVFKKVEGISPSKYRKEI